MDRSRNRSLSHFESHTTSSLNRTTSSSTSYSYSSSSNNGRQNVSNSLQYSAIGNTPSQSKVEAMKSKFLVDASLNRPAQPFEPPDQRNFASIPARQVNLPAQQQNSTLPTTTLPTTTFEPNPRPSIENKPSTSFLSRVFSFRSRKPNGGYALILNHETFDLVGKTARTGTHQDVNKLTTVFNMFNIETHVKYNLTLGQIKKKVKKLTRKNFSKYKCFIIVILTHGDGRHLYAKDGKYEFIETIEDPILTANKTILDKPKIFVTHASWDEKISFQTDAVPIPSATIKRNIFKCNAPHYHGAAMNGTFFMQTFCKQLKAKGKYYDFYELMTTVNGEVNSNGPAAPEISSIESTMTTSFCFGQLLN